MIILRCSSTDRVLACPSSLVQANTPINQSSTQALLGRAAHEWISNYSIGESSDMQDIAARHGVPLEDLEPLCAFLASSWKTLAPHFPSSPQTEVPLEAEIAESIILRGTVDLISITPDSLSILDWKTGRGTNSHIGQLKSYALLAYIKHGMPSSGFILVAEARATIGEVVVHRLSKETLELHREDLERAVAKAGREYSPGEPCYFCPRVAECQARIDYARSSIAALTTAKEELQAMDAGRLGLLYDRAKFAKSAIAKYDKLIDEALKDGPIDIGNGRELRTEEEAQEKLKAAHTLKWAREVAKLNVDEANALFSASKTALRSILAERAGKGKGAAAYREAMKNLKEHGAIEIKTVAKKKIVDVSKQIEGNKNK